MSVKWHRFTYPGTQEHVYVCDACYQKHSSDYDKMVDMLHCITTDFGGRVLICSENDPEVCQEETKR